MILAACSADPSRPPPSCSGARSVDSSDLSSPGWDERRTHGNSCLNLGLRPLTWCSAKVLDRPHPSAFSGMRQVCRIVVGQGIQWIIVH